jgi:uncharacterized protein YndB with AHSA1/START domain
MVSSMSEPTSASVSVEIDAPPEVVYDLIADVRNMGRWSPECRSCEWLDEPGRVGSRFKGRNQQGLARWSTEAEVLVAERGKEFTFATRHGDRDGTRWSYRLEGAGPTTLTESFEAVSAPLLIRLAERFVLRNRQQQLEDGMRRTIGAIKNAAETSTPT